MFVEKNSRFDALSLVFLPSDIIDRLSICGNQMSSKLSPL